MQRVKAALGAPSRPGKLADMYFPTIASDDVERLALNALERARPQLVLRPVLHSAGRSAGAGQPGAPDFVVVGTQRLGIEVTEVVRHAVDASEKETAAMRLRVIKQAERLAVARGHPPSSVSVHFRGGVSKGRAAALAAELVELVGLDMPQAGEGVRLVEKRWKDLPREVVNVRIDRVGIRDRVRWHSPSAHWVSRNGVVDIQATIQRKVTKHQRYLDHCDSCWLLLWIQIGTEAGAIELDTEVLSHHYESPFARTYLWDAWHDQIHELPCAPRPMLRTSTIGGD